MCPHSVYSYNSVSPERYAVCETDDSVGAPPLPLEGAPFRRADGRCHSQSLAWVPPFCVGVKMDGRWWQNLNFNLKTTQRKARTAKFKELRKGLYRDESFEQGDIRTGEKRFDFFSRPIVNFITHLFGFLTLNRRPAIGIKYFVKIPGNIP